MFYKKLCLFCIFLFLIFSFNITHANSQRNISLLYVLHARQGEIKTIGSQYELILKDPSLHYFTGHPAKNIGHITAQDFIQNWIEGKNGFQKNKPNSALISENKSLHHSTENTTFTILENPKFDDKKNLLSFDLKFINHQSNLKSGDYKNLDVFVDSCTYGASILGCF
jgi:hypothetical protein